VRLVIISFEADGLLEGIYRFFALALLDESDAKVAVCLVLIGLEADGFAACCLGFFVPVLGAQGLAEIA
jgi:hypothetical protein